MNQIWENTDPESQQYDSLGLALKLVLFLLMSK